MTGAIDAVSVSIADCAGALHAPTPKVSPCSAGPASAQELHTLQRSAQFPSASIPTSQWHGTRWRQELAFLHAVSFLEKGLLVAGAAHGKGLHTLGKSQHVAPPDPEAMLFAKVALRLLATLSVSHVYALRPQRLEPSCQRVPEPRG